MSRYSDGEFWGETVWYLLECQGCEHVFTQTVSINSEEWDDDEEGGGYVETTTYWPALSKRKQPDWMSEYGIEADDSDVLHAALKELYGALNHDLPMLAAIGIRTAFDIASELLKVDPAFTFAEKLDALVDTKRIREGDRESLEFAVDAGSASAHRGWTPKPSDLKVMTDILEHFVFDAFVGPHRKKKRDAAALKVKGTVPPKLPRQKKDKAAVPPVTDRLALPAPEGQETS